MKRNSVLFLMDQRKWSPEWHSQSHRPHRDQQQAESLPRKVPEGWCVESQPEYWHLPDDGSWLSKYDLDPAGRESREQAGAQDQVGPGKARARHQHLDLPSQSLVSIAYSLQPAKWTLTTVNKYIKIKAIYCCFIHKIKISFVLLKVNEKNSCSYSCSQRDNEKVSLRGGGEWWKFLSTRQRKNFVEGMG